MGMAALLLGGFAFPANAAAQSQERIASRCTVVDARVFPGQVQIVCRYDSAHTGSGSGNANRPVIGDPSVFALDLGIPALFALNAARLALEERRTLSITYKMAASKNPEGCATDDCRRLVAVLTN